MASLVLFGIAAPGSPALRSRSVRSRCCSALPAACAKEIAHYLGIAEATANAHVKHILEKLHVSDRLTAVITAWREGIIRE